MMKKFNLRVYALITDQNRILIVHEKRKGMSMTKFPGGGVEFGEGLLDALSRELKEEMQIEHHRFEHFYTTDFLQFSHFNPEDQVISIYYKTIGFDPELIQTEKAYHDMQSDSVLQFEWKNIESLNEQEFTFPIDRQVVKLLLQASSRR